MSDKAFKTSPYNYCDYRCEKCSEREHCRVYKDNEERILQHYLKGEDPSDPEIFLNDLKKIFIQTENMIMDMAKKQGIDMEDLSGQETPEVNPEEYVLYCIAHEYLTEASDFIKELRKNGVPPGIEEDLDNLIWYHTLIAAKSGRLVSGFIDDMYDDEMREIEEKGTLGVIKKGIAISQKALKNMLDELPGHLQRIADLTALLRRLEKVIAIDIHERVSQ